MSDKKQINLKLPLWLIYTISIIMAGWYIHTESVVPIIFLTIGIFTWFCVMCILALFILFASPSRKEPFKIKAFLILAFDIALMVGCAMYLPALIQVLWGMYLFARITMIIILWNKPIIQEKGKCNGETNV